MFKKIAFSLVAAHVSLMALPSAIYKQEYTYDKTYGNNISKSANKYIGIPYVWGGNSLKKGLDCSAFVKILVKTHTGVNLPRTAKNQALKTKKYTNITSFNQLKKGDAIYFKNKKGHIHHVALITGHDKDGYPYITHAKGKKWGVVREKISKKYINEFYVGKRFSRSQVKKKNKYRPIILKNL